MTAVSFATGCLVPLPRDERRLTRRFLVVCRPCPTVPLRSYEVDDVRLGTWTRNPGSRGSIRTQLKASHCPQNYPV